MANERVSVDIVVNTQGAQQNLTGLAGKIGLSVVSLQELVNLAKNTAKAVAQFAADSVREWAAYEQQVAKLDAVLKSTGGSAGYSTEALTSMASALQQITTFGDDTIISSQAVMATFKQIGRDVFPEAIKASMDLATVMNTDLQSATVLVGKALNDPILGLTSLRRVGVQLTTEQEKLVQQFMQVNDIASAQAVIMGELNSQFGGAAEAAGKTTAGALAQLANAFSDLKKSVGEALAGAIKPAIEALRDFFTVVAEGQHAVNVAEEAMKADLLRATTGRLEEYAKAIAKVVAQKRQEIANDASGILGAALESQIDEYEKQAREISRLLRGRSRSVKPAGTESPSSDSGAGYDIPVAYPFTPDMLRREQLSPSTTYEAPDYMDYMETQANAAREALIEEASALQAVAAEAENFTGVVTTSAQRVDEWARTNEYLESTLREIAATSFVDSMQAFGEYAYHAGLSVDDLGASIAHMGQQILNALPQMFLQAGLQQIIAGNVGLGLALIAMAGTTAFSAGYVNAAVNDSRTAEVKATSPSAAVAPSTTVNIENNTASPATATAKTLPDGSKVVEVVVGAVASSMARGDFDSIMTSRYGVSYAGVRR